MRRNVAKAELGTKRIDPETGKKFYDLNNDPIVSPFTGVSYPRSFFESGPAKPRPAPAKPVAEEEEVEEVVAEDAELISLEEADDEAAGGAVVDADGDEEEVEIADPEADEIFIEDEEEEGDDVADIIGDVDDEER
jgi:uncharacterized protein (TIGR02300 family)